MGIFSFLRRPGNWRLILLSNREPYEHFYGPDGAPVVTRPAGGLTAALIPAMAASGGTWIAWGSGAADFEVSDSEGRVLVPPEHPSFLLRRLRLTTEEVRQYYFETANRSLWPLCHLQLNHFAFSQRSWDTYIHVNRRFARAAQEEAAGRPATVWVQDYHLALVPALLRRFRKFFIHQFWHIPWPPPDVVRLLPSARQLLRGMLGNNLLAFHTRRHVLNFLGSARDLLPTAKVDLKRGVVTYRGRKTVVRAHPISIDVRAIERLADRDDIRIITRRLRRQYTPPGGQLVLGVDRIDYIKGIPHRLEAFSRLLEERPEAHGRVTLVQIAVPSRLELQPYQDLEREIIALSENINTRFGTPVWTPVQLLQENFDLKGLVAWYRAADVCVVSSVQDGMNLVAKEFVAAQKGRLGVLLLSEFAGAAEELEGALMINPFDVASLTRALQVALAMDPRERELRLRAMQRRVLAHTVGHWMDAIREDVQRLRGRA